MYRSISCIKVSDNKITNNINYTNSIFTMKRLFSYLMIFACLLGTAVVTSCSSDDDDKELSALPFESDAALYHLENNPLDYVYLELTTAGNYFIESTRMMQSKSKVVTINNLELPLLFVNDEPATRATKKNFEYGTYKKNDDGTYTLNDRNKAILEIKPITNSRYTITITEGDKIYEFTATRESRTYNSANVNKICRSWRLKKVYLNMKVNVMGVKTDITEEASNYNDLMKKLSKNIGSDYTETVEELDYISLNSTGSMIVKTDTNIRSGHWKWDEKSSTLYLTKGYATSSIAEIGYNVSFSGNNMKWDYAMNIDNGNAGSSSISIGYEFYETLVK